MDRGLGPIQDGLGLIHPIFSYCGRITVAFTGCRAMLPDPRFYEDCLRASFEDLRASTLDAATGDEAGRRQMRAACPWEAR